MSDDYRASQGSITPTMFVGIGGVGSRIVDRIASRARNLPHWSSQLRDLTNFVSIDTNELDQHKLEEIPSGNRLNIASFDKARAIENFRRSKDEQALHWIDSGYTPRPGISPGAGQIRIESRLGFFYHSPKIRQRLKDLVSRTLGPNITWRQSEPRKYNVYVYCSLAGGTGSGAFLSLAYLVDALIREQHWQPRLISNLLLSTLVLDKVGPELHPDIHANTYAALKELEHLTKLDYPQVRREGRVNEPFVYYRNATSPEVPTVDSRPFFLSFIFDSPAHLNLSDSEAAIADSSFLQIFSPSIDNLASELDNYEKSQFELTHFPGDLKRVGQGYSKNAGAFGAVALSVPGLDILEYCALRFAAEAVRSQITFGVDRSDPSDERALALAKFAVDYGDPRFQAKANEARERAISDAFVQSVREMARFDEAQDLLDGYWYRLAESVDHGEITGTDEEGSPIRAESRLGRIQRILEEKRRELFTGISMKERTFVALHREGLNQYLEYIAKLKEELRTAQQFVDQGIAGIESSAREGEAVSALKLDPIAERYLVLRLLDKVENEWLPKAKQARDKASKQGLDNPKVRERLERDEFETLQNAAASRSLLKKDQAFYDARDQAQEAYRRVASESRKAIEANAELRQLNEFLDYLRRRSSQYSRLAVRMDTLVNDLERNAERYRLGDAAVVRKFALCVEIFETLDEPRQRIWDEVYNRLFVQRGRYLSTFDRETLAETITREMRQIVRADGIVADKSVDQTVTDLRDALVELGRHRMRPRIMGGDGESGLDLRTALELEATIMVQGDLGGDESPTSVQVRDYAEKKFRAVAQLAGVLCRVDTTEASSLDDGVKVNRTRQLIVASDATGRSDEFIGGLKSVLERGGRQVKGENTPWYDRQLAIVHDAVLPIPFYYVSAITDEVEAAYQELAADESRSYNLHTDYHWEKSLPNLNPRGAEITVGWALQVIADGLIARVITNRDGQWLWNLEREGQTEFLGSHLTSALYRVGQAHRIEGLRQSLQRQLAKKDKELDEKQVKERREQLTGQLEQWMQEVDRREFNATLTREDMLDRPVLQALIEELKRGSTRSAPPSAAAYRGLDLD